jgi:hypothetical protein
MSAEGRSKNTSMVDHILMGIGCHVYFAKYDSDENISRLLGEHFSYSPYVL